MTTTSEKIIENLKKYCEGEYATYTTFGHKIHQNPRQLIDRCYGATMYTSYLLNHDDCTTVGQWWDNEMRPKLYSLFD